jgi:hypothetical protein
MEDDYSVEKIRIQKLSGPNYRSWMIQLQRLLLELGCAPRDQSPIYLDRLRHDTRLRYPCPNSLITCQFCHVAFRNLSHNITHSATERLSHVPYYIPTYSTHGISEVVAWEDPSSQKI